MLYNCKHKLRSTNHNLLRTVLYCIYCIRSVSVLWYYTPHPAYRALPTRPLFATGGLEAVSGLAAITDALKNYRPAQTVLEAEVSRGRGPLMGGTNSSSTSVLGRMMLHKRAAHSGTIAAAKQRQDHLQACHSPVPFLFCTDVNLTAAYRSKVHTRFPAQWMCPMWYTTHHISYTIMFFASYIASLSLI